jgi:hypothetical protein
MRLLTLAKLKRPNGPGTQASAFGQLLLGKPGALPQPTQHGPERFGWNRHNLNCAAFVPRPQRFRAVTLPTCPNCTTH